MYLMLAFTFLYAIFAPLLPRASACNQHHEHYTAEERNHVQPTAHVYVDGLGYTPSERRTVEADMEGDSHHSEAEGRKRYLDPNRTTKTPPVPSQSITSPILGGGLMVLGAVVVVGTVVGVRGNPNMARRRASVLHNGHVVVGSEGVSGRLSNVM